MKTANEVLKVLETITGKPGDAIEATILIKKLVSDVDSVILTLAKLVDVIEGQQQNADPQLKALVNTLKRKAALK